MLVIQKEGTNLLSTFYRQLNEVLTIISEQGAHSNARLFNLFFSFIIRFKPRRIFDVIISNSINFSCYFFR